MDWLKKNPAQIALAVIALGVFVTLVMLFGKIRSFPELFSYSPPPQNNKVEKMDSAPLAKAAEDFNTPPGWKSEASAGSLFVSDVYLLKDGKSFPLSNDGEPLHPPISNGWLGKYGLEITSATIQTEDKDGDGFTNLDEWLGQDGVSHLDTLGQPVNDAAGKPLPDDSTDPSDINSYPPYLTKLVLADIKNIPFRMVFKSWDGDRSNQKEMTFQINTLDFQQPTMFLKLGEPVPNSKFKLESFKFNEVPNAAKGYNEDLSELTLVHVETKKPVVLILAKVTNSPESYAVFSYKWVKTGETPTGNFGVKAGQEFSLPPEADKKYKIIDIGETEVQIQTPAGEKKTLRQTK